MTSTEHSTDTQLILPTGTQNGRQPPGTSTRHSQREADSSEALDVTTNVGSPIKNSIARVAGYIFGLARAAPAQELRTHEEDGTSGNKAVEEPAHEEGEVVRSPYIPRKRPPPRDIYQHPSTPDGSGEEKELRANSPRKRARKTVKAKEPITEPHRTLRSRTILANGSPRAVPEQMIEPNAMSFPVPSSPHKAAEDVAAQPAKRGRGRPRKNPPPPPRTMPTRSVSTGKDTVTSPCAARKVSQMSTVSSPRPVREEATVPSEVEGEPEEQVEQHQHGEQEADDEEDDGGVSSILLNPSPIKVSRDTTGQSTGNPHMKTKNTEDNEQREVEGSPMISEDEGRLVDESEEEGSEVGAGVGLEKSPGEHLVDMRVIDDMIITAGRVGYSYNKENQEWTLKTSHKVCSSNGKRMIRRLRKTLGAYHILQKAIDTGDSHAAKKTRKSIDEQMENIQTESHSILTTRLGNPLRGIDFFDADKTRIMLMDLYFLIIPDLLEILKLAAQVYPLQRSTDRWALQQSLAITTILKDLASTAALQPKASKPRASSKSGTYQMSKPSSLILPAIRKIRNSLSSELAKRAADQKASELKASQAERSTQIEEEERLQKEEHRRLRKENRRQQTEAYNSLCSEPLWGRLLRYKMEATGPFVSSRDLNSADLIGCDDDAQDQNQHQDVEDDDDPFTERQDEDDDGPRLSVFGKNNKNDSTRSRPLSETEKGIFIECMMNERGEDRYEKAAKRLERSIEEIFTFAQDLQEAIDQKRETGHFMSQKDAWTYVIWVEKEVK
ncbi:hypothetical protein WAI453_009898 [Rhynchosporium graminicola]|uniref:Uncharacterized protein n=1 Tax=Rhynchosporium graminicola TaxID=2792576 RepID=A0A1E1KE76_9HELO|nr:uncharacterized protein RCO7_04931 [Rhynchosporium commune]